MITSINAAADITASSGTSRRLSATTGTVLPSMDTRLFGVESTAPLANTAFGLYSIKVLWTAQGNAENAVEADSKFMQKVSNGYDKPSNPVACVSTTSAHSALPPARASTPAEAQARTEGKAEGKAEGALIGSLSTLAVVAVTALVWNVAQRRRRAGRAAALQSPEAEAAATGGGGAAFQSNPGFEAVDASNTKPGGSVDAGAAVPTDCTNAL
eukprot:g5420.t1